MASNSKIQKQLLQQAITVFQDKWNGHNPDDQIQLRMTPNSHTSGDKISMSLVIDMRKGPELLYTVLKAVTLGGRVVDSDILTSNLYAGMFVELMTTSLLIAVADLERRQHETATGGGNQILN
jgi:hypothetical protein